MNSHLSISETTQSLDAAHPRLISNLLKITNTSNDFINNVKLIISPEQLPIREEAIIRQRGSLSFNPSIYCLELGNLAPNETAYFEYKFLSPSSHSSLCEHFSISYCMGNAEPCVEEHISSYLATEASPPSNVSFSEDPLENTNDF